MMPVMRACIRVAPAAREQRAKPAGVARGACGSGACGAGVASRARGSSTRGVREWRLRRGRKNLSRGFLEPRRVHCFIRTVVTRSTRKSRRTSYQPREAFDLSGQNREFHFEIGEFGFSGASLETIIKNDALHGGAGKFRNAAGSGLGAGALKKPKFLAGEAEADHFGFAGGIRHVGLG